MQDVAEEVVQIHKAMGAGIDVSFDCAGFNKTMSTALSATSAGGKVCLVGMGHSEMTVPLTPAAARYFDVIMIKRFGLRNYAEIFLNNFVGNEQLESLQDIGIVNREFGISSKWNNILRQMNNWLRI